jgi:hypothetical protein
VQRRTSGPNRKDETGEQIEIRNEEINNSIIYQIKKDDMLAHLVYLRNTYTLLLLNLKGRDHPEDICVGEKAI